MTCIGKAFIEFSFSWILVSFCTDVTVLCLHQSVLSSALHFPGSSCLHSWTHSLISHLFLIFIICVTCSHLIMSVSCLYLVLPHSVSLCRVNVWCYPVFAPVPCTLACVLEVKIIFICIWTQPVPSASTRPRDNWKLLWNLKNKKEEEYWGFEFVCFFFLFFLKLESTPQSNKWWNSSLVVQSYRISPFVLHSKKRFKWVLINMRVRTFLVNFSLNLWMTSTSMADFKAFWSEIVEIVKDIKGQH